jgi:hypothetical protein
MQIKLTNSNKIATIDDADYDLIKDYVWWEHKISDKLSYAYGMKLPRKRRGEQVVKMHRLIMGLNKGDSSLDHIDGDGLNNSRGNLRPITMAQNLQKANFDPARNSKKVHSKYRGVSYLSWHKKYLAYINCAGKREYLGYFDTDAEAAQARDARAKELHGKFARLNFEDS